VSFGIIVPLVVLTIIIIGASLWYRRSMADMKPTDHQPLSAVRLTAEALHRSPSPRWRAVYEIGGALGDVDHIVVGPPGAIAITTLVADRPEPSLLLGARSDDQLVSEAAIARGPIELLRRPAHPAARRRRVAHDRHGGRATEPAPVKLRGVQH